MLEPHLATMFCFVATDGAVARGALSGSCGAAVDHSSTGSRSIPTVHQRHVSLLANGLAEKSAGGGRRPGPAQFAAGSRP